MSMRLSHSLFAGYLRITENVLFGEFVIGVNTLSEYLGMHYLIVKTLPHLQMHTFILLY